MATYQPTDRVIFLHPLEDDETYNGVINRIVEDNLDEDDVLYEIQYDINERRTATVDVFGIDVVALTGGPTHEARQRERETVRDGLRTATLDGGFRWAAPRPMGAFVAEDPTPTATAAATEPAPRPRMSSGIYDSIVGAIRPGRQVPMSEPEVMSDRPTPRGDGEVEEARPTHVDTEVRLPEVTEAVDISRLTSRDYMPSTSSTRLHSFRIRGLNGDDTILTPVLNRETMRMEFRDNNRNEVWINRIQEHGIGRYLNATDIHGVNWMRLATFTELESRNGRSLSELLRPRKKLRFKYGKMPSIGKESDYASKKYIA